MLVARLMERRVRRLLKEYPAVALLDPRQSGKSTLAKQIARPLGGRYFDLELETDQLRLDLEWDERVRGSRLVVIDETQAWPQVFPRLRAAIDADRRRNSRFLLLGSVSPALIREISESLAGLNPFTPISRSDW